MLLCLKRNLARTWVLRLDPIRVVEPYWRHQLVFSFVQTR
jgi:hypothetical protein